MLRNTVSNIFINTINLYMALEYKINAQNDTIDIILMALEETIQGKGIATACSIDVKRGNYGSTIIFTPNGMIEITPQDFFWLGYYVGRDYKVKDFNFTIVSDDEKKKNKSILRRNTGS